MTFGSPRSNAGSSSGTSHLPRSLSSSWNSSETSTKKFINDANVSPSSSQNSSALSSSLASSFVNQKTQKRTHDNSPRRGFSEMASGSSFRPNISLSDDSVTANASVGPNGKRSPKSKKHHYSNLKSFHQGKNNNNNNSHNNNNLSHSGVTRSSDALAVATAATQPSSSPSSPSSSTSSNPSKPIANPNTFTSTTRPRIASHEKSSDSPYRLIEPNLSRIPNADSSIRHGMYVDGPGTSMMVEPSMTNNSRSRSYAAVNGGIGGVVNNSRSGFPSYGRGDRGVSHRNSYHAGDQGEYDGNGGSSWRHLNLNRVGSCENNALQQSTTMCEPYSLADMDDVLCGDSISTSNAGSRGGGGMDDDNTTTTSGSYTINADDLCHEIDHLFFKDIVV